MAYKIKQGKIDELVEVLNLNRKTDRKTGKTIYKTMWGDKTETGVKETIKNILEVEEE